MSNLFETPLWEQGVYQLKTSDPVAGGEVALEEGVVISGHANVQGLQLANRTSWLKQQIESLQTTQNVQSDGLQEDRSLLVYDSANNVYSSSYKWQSDLHDYSGGTALQTGSFGLGSWRAKSFDFSSDNITDDSVPPTGFYEYSGSNSFIEDFANTLVITMADVVEGSTEPAPGTVLAYQLIPPSVSQGLTTNDSFSFREFGPFGWTGHQTGGFTDGIPIALLDERGCQPLEPRNIAIASVPFCSNVSLDLADDTEVIVAEGLSVVGGNSYNAPVFQLNLEGKCTLNFSGSVVPNFDFKAYVPIQNPCQRFTIIIKNTPVGSGGNNLMLTGSYKTSNANWAHPSTSTSAYSVIECMQLADGTILITPTTFT